MTPEVWQELRLRPDDVILSSYLRSGSNWMRHILRLLRNEGKDDGVNLDDAVPWLDGLRSSVGADIMRLNANLDANALPSPRYFKVHLPYELTPGGLPHTTNSKYIYIARNPKDHSVSQWHFCQTELPKLTDHDSKPWDEYLSDFLAQRKFSMLFGGWLGHVLEWWEHRDEPNILFIKYEELKKEPHNTIKRIAEFIGTEPLTEEQ